MESLKRSVRRKKRGNVPAEPAQVERIPHPLPSQYMTTSPDAQETFLVYDNGSLDARMLVFASDSGLQLLGASETWFCDGTHSSAPAQFAQLFCVRVPMGNSHVTAAYALLPGKQQSTYEELFTALLDSCLQRDIRPNVTVVVCDYEIAIHNAVRTTLCSQIRVQVYHKCSKEDIKLYIK